MLITEAKYNVTNNTNDSNKMNNSSDILISLM